MISMWQYAVWFALLLSTARLAASEWTADTWTNCGGSQFCPCGTSNCDSQWPSVYCKEWDYCQRQDPTWWRCEPRSSACWKQASTWSACGGSNNCPWGTSNCDAPWKGYCCQHGEVCVRQTSNWWRCEPMSNYADSHTCNTYAATWASCGWRICCSTPGDSCVYKSNTWSRCEPTDSAVTPASPPRGSPPPPLRLRGNRIVTADKGQEVTLRGINWFGFNVARQMVDGLGHGGSNAETDFATIVYELRMLGYNTVRLPFRYRDLDEQYPKDYTVKCWDMSTEDMRRRLMDYWTDKQLPGNKASVWRNSGYCNNYLPSSSTYTRLMYTIQAFISQGIYVILDYQPMGTEPQAYNVQKFGCKWRNLVSRVMAIPNWGSDIKGRVFLDILNEPDSMNIKWEANAGNPAARDLYLLTLDAIHSMVPDGFLYILEGTGQNNFGLNWGNGFVTDTNIIQKYGLSDPNYFFRQLLSKPYVDKVIFSPHLYPPSITKASFLGVALWQQSSIAFGYLQTRGFCNAGTCTTFPVVVGETGSFMTDSGDNQWLLDFADFVNAKGSARSYTSVPAAGWLWWCYNENSGDTGGIIWDNWSKLDWVKLRYMINSLALTPWYKDNFAY